MLGEYSEGETTHYLLGLDVIGQETSTGWSYNGYDGLGSVRGMFDGTAAVVQSATYAPYGSLISQTGWATSLGFTGEMHDVTGLVHLRARMYNPAIGMFLQRDPVMGVLGGPSVYSNPYLYVHANPINLIDPSGEFIPLAVALFIGGAAIGAGISLLLQINHLHKCGITEPSAVWDRLDWGKVITAGAFGGMVALYPWVIAKWGAIGLGGAALGNSLASGVATFAGTAVGNILQGKDPLENQSIWAIGSSMFFGAVFGGFFGLWGGVLNLKGVALDGKIAVGITLGGAGVVATTAQTIVTGISNPNEEMTQEGVSWGAFSGLGYTGSALAPVPSYAIGLFFSTIATTASASGESETRSQDVCPQQR